MAARSPEMRRQAAMAGAATRWGKEGAVDARRELAEQRIAEHIKKVVASAPPLTTEQRDRLALLLRGHA